MTAPASAALTPAIAPRAPCAELIDPRGRRLDYLRLAVTERCNLKCSYCRPAGASRAAAPGAALSVAEAVRLGTVFCDLGVRKIRLTGGEPLVRRDLVALAAALAGLPQRPEILLTTNGTRLVEHLPALVAAGIKRVNLSLDSLEPDTWRRITGDGDFAAARAAVDAVLERGLGLKINVVVLAGTNDHELPAFARLTRELPVDVRFIEAMPFDGQGGRPQERLDGEAILARLRRDFALEELPQGGVARRFRVAGHVGCVGIIEGHTRSFCGSCRRLRLDARGRLRTCLYGASATDLLGALRAGAGDDELAAAVRRAVAARATDGHAAQGAGRPQQLESMVSIGG